MSRGWSFSPVPVSLRDDERFLELEDGLSPSELLLRLYAWGANAHGIFPAGGRALAGNVRVLSDPTPQLQRLEAAGLVITYQAEGREWGIIVGYDQSAPSDLVKKRGPSNLPTPPEDVAKRAGYTGAYRRSKSGRDPEPSDTGRPMPEPVGAEPESSDNDRTTPDNSTCGPDESDRVGQCRTTSDLDRDIDIDKKRETSRARAREEASPPLPEPPDRPVLPSIDMVREDCRDHARRWLERLGRELVTDRAHHPTGPGGRPPMTRNRGVYGFLQAHPRALELDHADHLARLAEEDPDAFRAAVDRHLAESKGWSVNPPKYLAGKVRLVREDLDARAAAPNPKSRDRPVTTREPTICGPPPDDAPPVIRKPHEIEPELWAISGITLEDVQRSRREAGLPPLEPTAVHIEASRLAEQRREPRGA